MKSSLALLMAVLLLWLEAARGQNIQEIVEQRQELTKLAKFMRNLSVMREFSKLGTKKYTFFAPSNTAFENIPSHVSQHFQEANEAVKKERDDIMRYQTVLGVVNMNKMLKNEMLHSYGPDSNLFIFVVNGDHFVNGAKVLVPDIVASNGVVHIIDSLMYERGKSVNAYSYITETGTQLTNPSERTTSFKELFDQYIEYEIAQHGGEYNARDELNGVHKVDGKILPVTVFVPSDEAIAKIPQQQLSLLKADSVELKKVIEGHLVLGAALYTNILLRPDFRDILAMSGRIAVKKFLGNVYARNTCAQGMVTHGNITVKNGVVHIVDGLLGYVYSDAITQLHDQTQYQWFYSHVSLITDIVRMLTLPRGTTTVPDNMMYTVFAPVGVRGVDLTQHPNELDKAMRMHLIKGRVEVSDMINNTRHVTMNSEQTATFYLVDDGMYVEVNYVRAKITKSDICVKNGILHNIDTVLGVPVDTIASAISDNEKELLQLREAVRNTGLWTYLNDKTKLVTMFAPVDKAFQRMQDDPMGRKLLNPQHERNLQKMLQRHIIVEEVFLDTITDTKTFKTNLGDDIDIVKVGTEYRIRFGSKDIGVIRANMRMTNGVLHLIDDVIYSDDPSAAEWTSTAPVTSQCSLLLVTVLLYHIFSRMSWTRLYL